MARVGIDILAPQDYGGRSRDVREALGYVLGHARALEQVRRPLSEAGIALWSNCELFVFERTPSGRYLTLPAPIERVVEQIRLQAPLVDKLICYQYQGLLNRHTKLVDIGHPSSDHLYRDYLAYLRRSFPERFPV